MSCGKPHETDCSEVLDHLYEYLDNEMSDDACAKFKQHFDECHPCLEKYGLEQAVKKLVKRCCGQDDVPVDLRTKVLRRLDQIRAGRIAPGQRDLSDDPRGPDHPRPEPPSEPRTRSAVEGGGASAT
jgi:anti-sigma factor (TIGR02949 family)